MKRKDKLNNAVQYLADIIEYGNLMLCTDPAELIITAVERITKLEAERVQNRQWAALWKRVAKKYHEYYRLRDDCNMHCHGYLQQWADRAKKAEAELAALRARRCETCVTYINPSATGWGHCTYYNEFREHDTVCRRWEARRSRNER